MATMKDYRENAMSLAELCEQYSISIEDAQWYIGTHRVKSGEREGESFSLFHLLVGQDPDTDENRYLSFGLSLKESAKGSILNDDFIYDNADSLVFLEAEDEGDIGSMWCGGEDPRHTGFKRE